MRLNENEMSVILCLRGWRSRFFVELNNSLDRSDGGAEHWPAIKCTFKVTSTVASCGAIQIFVLLIEFSDPLVCFLLTGYGYAGHHICVSRLVLFYFFFRVFEKLVIINNLLIEFISRLVCVFAYWVLLFLIHLLFF